MLTFQIEFAIDNLGTFVEKCFNRFPANPLDKKAIRLEVYFRGGNMYIYTYEFKLDLICSLLTVVYDVCTMELGQCTPNFSDEDLDFPWFK